MSKPFTSGLTGLRKKKRKQRQNRSKPSALTQAIEAQDQALNFIRHIETLAGLLEVAGETAQAVPLPGALIGETGGMIIEQAGRLRDTLETIHQILLAHATHP